LLTESLVLEFYGNRVPEEIIEYAQTARKEIKKSIGSYSEYVDAVKNPQKYTEDFWNSYHA
jgi:hypothetical protein